MKRDGSTDSDCEINVEAKHLLTGTTAAEASCPKRAHWRPT